MTNDSTKNTSGGCCGGSAPKADAKSGCCSTDAKKDQKSSGCCS